MTFFVSTKIYRRYPRCRQGTWCFCEYTIPFGYSMTKFDPILQPSSGLIHSPSSLNVRRSTIGLWSLWVYSWSWNKVGYEFLFKREVFHFLHSMIPWDSLRHPQYLFQSFEAMNICVAWISLTNYLCLVVYVRCVWFRCKFIKC